MGAEYRRQNNDKNRRKSNDRVFRFHFTISFGGVICQGAVFTARDLSFCLEYRTVEVRGQQIDLTAKEFEILALLITHQKRVFTYEMIMDLVWHEDYSYYSRKAINNHISNLRKKLKIAPDVPEYIKSVHSVGYKFEA